MHLSSRFAWSAALLLTFAGTPSPTPAQAPFHPERAGVASPVLLTRRRVSSPLASGVGLSEHSTRPRRWPWFTLGGALLGAGAMTALILTQCDEHCRDDGGYGFGFALYVPAAAGIGALAGTAIGLIVDHNRPDTSRSMPGTSSEAAERGVPADGRSEEVAPTAPHRLEPARS